MRQVRLLALFGALLALQGGAWADEAPDGSLPATSPEASRLIARLDADDPYIRQEAFLELEMLREPATVPAIRQRLESRNAETRAFSVRALAALEGVKAVPALLERLKRDSSPRVRVSALLALEPLQDPTILPVLIDKLRDRNRDVRIAAADAVSRVKQPEARAAIQRRWRRERDRDVRRVLEKALARLEEADS